MSRVTAIVVALAAIVAVAIAAVFVLLANPDYYRPQLQATFTEETGFELDIAGDLNWRYWPPIALNINGVDVRPPGSTIALAHIDAAAVDLDLLPLLFGSDNLAIKGITIDGLSINARIDKDGHANWAVVSAAQDEPQPETESTGEGMGLDIRESEFTNIAIDYQDETSNTHYIVTVPFLRTGRLLYDEMTPMQTQVTVSDKVGGMETKLDAEGNITFNRGFSRFGMNGLALKPSITMPDTPAIDLDLTLDGSFDTDTSRLESKLKGRFNKSTVDGDVNVDLADKISAAFNLSLDAIDVNEYLASDDASASAVASASPQDSEVLPVDLLNDYDLAGEIRIAALTYDTYRFTDFVANIDNRAKKLKANLTMRGYDGDISIVFNATTENKGAGHTHANVSGLDMTKFTEFEWITGKLTLESNTTFTGNMLSDVMKTLDGTTAFEINNGTLDVTPIKQVAGVVDGLRGKDSGIGSWPDKMPFENLNGQHRFVAGAAKNQQLSFKLENLNVDGTGGFDYFASHLAYDMAITMTETTGGQFHVAPGLARIKWPLHCEGAMDASPVDLCLPNSDAIKRLVTDVAKQEIRRKGEDAIREKIAEKVPDDLKESAKDLFKGLFKKKDD